MSAFPNKICSARSRSARKVKNPGGLVDLRRARVELR